MARTLAVFSVSRLSSASPQLHRRSIVPSWLFEGKAFSLEEFYEWEDQPATLIIERRVQEDAEAKKRVELAQAESQTGLATILRTASTSAPQGVAHDELDEMLDELDGIAA